MASFKEKIELNKGRHAYMEGVYAAQHGKSLNSNPYAVLTSFHRDWSDGYLDVVFLGEL
jgi:hypothetical protein